MTIRRANAAAILQLAELAGVRFDPAPRKADKVALAVHDAGLIMEPERYGPEVEASIGAGERHDKGGMGHGAFCGCVACLAIIERERLGDLPADEMTASILWFWGKGGARRKGNRSGVKTTNSGMARRLNAMLKGTQR